MSQERIGWGAAPRALMGELPALAPAFLVALVIAALLVPLPQGIVDLLLSASLAFSVLVFVAALRLDSPLRFLHFPSLLLLVTSFRLVLNTATTRLILGEGDAGRVIDAFAGFVTRGDLVVGIVMFGIITAIQYLVIARGTERVAEVGARFALDGMPGRQAAIEADLRAESISPAEAARRRAELDARSEFNGNMDGAVKFVKADAIVGLIIVAINLVGGLAIGVVRGGLDISQALDLYGRLAIGDGLLSQIPAVLLSLSAGLLVSRVDAHRLERQRSWLEPAMLLVPAALLLGVAFIPGMPTLAFGLVGLALLAAALASTAYGSSAASRSTRGLELRLPSRFAGAEPQLARAFAGVKAQAEANLGVAMPGVHLHFGDADSPLELRRGDHLLLRERVDSDDSQALLLPVFRALVANGEQFLDLTILESWFEQERRVRPAAVRSALARLDAAQILAVLRALLREQVPLPSPREIIAAVAENAVFSDADERERWPAHLRLALADTWVRDLVDARAGDSEAGATFARATPDLELAFEAHAEACGDRLRCRLSATRRAAVCAALQDALPSTGSNILITRSQSRAAAAACLVDARPRVPVLAIAELERAGIDFHAAAWLDESAFDAPA